MVLARWAEYLTPSPPDQQVRKHKNGEGTPFKECDAARSDQIAAGSAQKQEEEEEEGRPPFIHAALAGGLGGVTGDMLMHSLDTVKTRQQGDPHWPPKYTTLGNSYFTIFRQEGIARGLYGGVQPAFVGSFGGTFVFFGFYEWSKRRLLDLGIAPSVSYFTAGLIADLAASPLYVPTEVLKTRLQLQGRYNNPFFTSGYNYRSTWNATRTIYRNEGLPALFYGFRATLYRDLPFSALQFAFYEKERQAAKWWVGSSEIGLPLEIVVGASAGGAAGIITCPLDVVKTRIQTQVNPPDPRPTQSTQSTQQGPTQNKTISKASPSQLQAQQRRHISGSSPPAKSVQRSVTLDTSSVLRGLRIIYRSEGVLGWLRGVGPRAVWTSIQSGTMLVLYQVFLQKLDQYPIVRD